MQVVVCDICRREVVPWGKPWNGRGGVRVSVLHADGYQETAGLQHEGRWVQDVCAVCLPKCTAVVIIRPCRGAS